MNKKTFVIETVKGFEEYTCDLDSSDPSEWRPCPFCGGHGYGHIENGLWYITCGRCQSETDGYVKNITACRAWQRGAIDPSAELKQGRLF